MGPIAFKDNQWVGFDDEIMIENKVKYIKSKGELDADSLTVIGQ